jgi:hypothetical protein
MHPFEDSAILFSEDGYPFPEKESQEEIEAELKRGRADVVISRWKGNP